MDRLVLGSGSLDAAFVERLSGRPGSLVVLVDDDRRVQSLREAGVDARGVDPTDPNAVRAVAGPPERLDPTVVVNQHDERARASSESLDEGGVQRPGAEHQSVHTHGSAGTA